MIQTTTTTSASIFHGTSSFRAKTMILRKRCFVIRTMVILTLASVAIMGFPAGPSLHSSNLAEPFEASRCPFVKFFPRHRVDLIARRKPKQQESLPSAWFSSLAPLKGLSDSLSKRQIQEQIRSGERWIYAVEKDGISAFARLWTEADYLLQTSDESSVVISLPDATPPLVQNWVNILSWLSSNYPWESESIQLNASILDGTQEGTATSVRLEKQGAGIAPVSWPMVDASIINQRTQSWVKRILVEQGICPFTKSVKMSGQGLADVGVPVASIAYHASHATHPVTLFSHAFQAMEDMLQAGPVGKSGVSSILLAAPRFDEDFDLWSGPIFAILEASVVAAMAESQIGVVCFHPKYACPDGSSWPGFGHMHSVTRLEKWYQEARSANETSDCPLLSTENVAAGGAWQRRTPHATINVLRADQLAAAEAKRTSAELYAVNIEKLVGKRGIGSDQLFQDLMRERHLP